MFRVVLAAAAVVTLVTAPASAEIARVKRVLGAAFVQRGARQVPATLGFALEESDTLVTGRDGRIGLTFVDNTRFAVGPNSSVRVAAFRFDDTTRQGRFYTSVDRGSLAIVSGQIAHENRDAMKVRTPTSLLAVRGTRFVVTVR